MNYLKVLRIVVVCAILAGCGCLYLKIDAFFDEETKTTVKKVENAREKKRESAWEKRGEESAWEKNYESVREQIKSAHEQLESFLISSRFYMHEEEYTANQPVIVLTVKNVTDQAVSRAYFEGTLASPDRTIPWHQGTFNHSIPGGLEPGEVAYWELVPNRYSEWGRAGREAPADAVFTVTVKDLDGADGESIYPTIDWTTY